MTDELDERTDETDIAREYILFSIDNLYTYENYVKTKLAGDFACEISKTLKDRDSQIQALSTKAREQGWQPIETAPKDGTCILGLVYSEFFGTSWQAVMCWGDITKDESGVCDWVSPLGDGRGRVDSCTSEPTHWRPLPPKPTQAKKLDNNN